MIPASADLLALIQSGQYARADLYAITPKGAQAPFYWTSADRDLVVGGVTYSALGPALERGRCKLVVGLEVDTLDLTVTVDPAREPLVSGVPLRQAAQRGMLDGADVSLSWAYLPDWSLPLRIIGTSLRFVGQAGNIEVGNISVKIPVNSPLKRLDVQVPGPTYGAGCPWVLGGTGCGLDLSAWAKTGHVLAGASDGAIPCDLGDADATFTGGKVLVTSGSDWGVRRTVRLHQGGVLTLATPLPWVPQAGDQITVWPGCDHALPVVQVGSWSGVVPASGVVTLGDWAADMGVMLGASSTQLVIYDEYGNEQAAPSWITAPGIYSTRISKENFDYYQVVEKVVTSSQPMASVAGTPASGQYSIAPDNSYRFAAAQVGQSVRISYRQWVSGGKSCARFGNFAHFGGQPFIPAPETAL